MRQITSKRLMAFIIVVLVTTFWVVSSQAQPQAKVSVEQDKLSQQFHKAREEVRGKKEGFGTAVIPVKISGLNHIFGVFSIPVCLSEKIIKSHLLISHPLGIQGGVWI
jgi:hypothetical protein